MNWHNRLTQARLAKNIKKSDFAKLIGVSAPTVTQWENGETKKIEGSNLVRVCSVLEISPEWLLHGTSEMAIEPGLHIPGAMRVVVVDEDSPGIVRIPLGSLKLQAGVNGVSLEPDRRDGGTLGISLNWVQRKGYDPEQLIAMPVTGDSMAPTICEGDTVIINKSDKKLVDNAVYAINYEGEPVVKRMARDAGQWWMMSDNPDQRRYFRRACHGKDCIIIGRVVRREGDQF
ncbi:helix-turn-helix domain-containing protein [Duganella sp. FT92W]|uniref:Helix-turn-helix domain-containing protein n=1 Tax=Pseudoduganella rivuli TaxID=2666085 RepID=A0A7X2IME5_9BURK|nr:S24 family peptidase [Pseudoduganella rivuli]MRV72535.1 helix-turn-helix domain-containing protein [Pseudoduganella rivuli]